MYLALFLSSSCSPHNYIKNLLFIYPIAGGHTVYRVYFLRVFNLGFEPEKGPLKRISENLTGKFKGRLCACISQPTTFLEDCNLEGNLHPFGSEHSSKFKPDSVSHLTD